MKRPVYSFTNKAKRLVWYCVQATLFRFSPILFHGFRSALLRMFGAKIGKSNFIYPTAKIWAPWMLETEDVVTLGSGVEVYNPGGVYLGHHTVVSQNAYLCCATHDYNTFTFDTVIKPIKTGPYTWICSRAIVLPGVEFGTGSVLGAGGVASRSLDDWSVHAGNPAKHVTNRKPFDVNASPEELERKQSE